MMIHMPWVFRYFECDLFIYNVRILWESISMKHVGIIGGGVIGLCCAYYLQKSGVNVTIIDDNENANGCSFGNAGMIVPSHIIPLASPGMITKGIRWMFQSTSPFYIKPRLSPDLLRWGYVFYKHANSRHVEKATPALKEISVLSRALFGELKGEIPCDVGFQERGLLMLYKTKETEHEERKTAQLANRHGIETQILSADEVQSLEPDIKVNVRGGILFPNDAHLTPQVFMQSLKSILVERGVRFIHEKVQSFVLEAKKIKNIQCEQSVLQFDEVVLAAGAWSSAIAKILHLNIPLQAGKGYSFEHRAGEGNIRIPSILLESRVAATPMGNTIRFGGTMEIGGINNQINLKRVEGIIKAIPNYYPDIKVPFPSADKIWSGLRPCSPDGLPYLGRVSTVKNLVIATGHSMMGLSLGPATGKLVAELIVEKPTSINIQPFKVERF